MIKAILRFFTPLVVLGVTAVLGWGTLKLLQKADAQHVDSLKPAANTNQTTQPTVIGTNAPPGPYCWRPGGATDPANTIEKRIPVPPGYEREQLNPGDWQDWLRKLPLKPQATTAPAAGPVAAVDLDLSDKSIQHGADAVLRLRTEYQYSRERYKGGLQFDLATGQYVVFDEWARGIRPIIDGQTVTWTKPPRHKIHDVSYASFHSYLDTILTYGGPNLLDRNSTQVIKASEMLIGEIFVQKGNPSNAAIVLDMATGPSGRKAFLLAQWSPTTKELQILRNARPADTRILPWYDLNFGQSLTTPAGNFARGDLKSWALPKKH